MNNELNNSYLTLHHAAQFVAAVGKSYLPERKDDSHTNLQWIFGRNQIAGEWIQAPGEQIRFAVDLNDFTLQVHNYNETSGQVLNLQKNRIPVVTDWIKTACKEYGLDPELYNPEMHYQIPDHPVQKGESFFIEKELLGQLRSFFSNAYVLLKELAGSYPQSDEIRIWPHHFDIATFLPLEYDASNKLTRSVGVGLAAPDIYYNEPYYYVNRWPQIEQDVKDLPELKGGGTWHEKDWKGAILKTSELQNTSQENQLVWTSEFLSHAVSELISL